MNSLMLVLALSSGQGPGGAPTVPGYYPVVPTAAPVGRLTALPEVIQHPVVTQQQPVVPPTRSQPGIPTAANANGNGNGSACAPCAEEKEEAPEPWALMRVLKGTGLGERLEKNRIEISGWTQGNYTASTAKNNYPVTFNDRGDFWQLNQNFLRVDRTIDKSKKEFQLGGRTEWILPGTDARYTIARNLLDDQTGEYRIDLFQVYVEAFMPNVGPQGTTLRLGKFATHVGYELVEGAETPFLTRSYIFLFDPYSHTGVWAITPLNDTWSVSYGLSLGTDNFIGSPARPTFLGQLKWAPKEGKSSVALNCVVSDPTFDVGQNFVFYNCYNMVVTHKFTDKLSGALDVTASNEDGVPGLNGAVWWYGTAAYLFYQFNDKWNLAFRQDLFEDDKGVRTGFAGLYSGTTLGIGFTPVRSLMLRPSVRFDHNFDANPWDGNQNLFTACMDVIIRW